MTLMEAVASLDPSNPDHWTADNAPRMDVLKQLTGDDELTRPQVTDAAPQLTRLTATEFGPVAEAEADSDSEPEADSDSEPDSDAGEVPEWLVVITSQEPMGQEEFMQFLSTVPSEDLGMLEEAVLGATELVNTRLGEAQEWARNLKMQLSFTRNRIRNEVPDMTDAEARRKYIESSNAQRVARAERRAQLIGMGATPEDVSGLSPIDRAMARKNARGGERPNRGTKV